MYVGADMYLCVLKVIQTSRILANLIDTRNSDSLLLLLFVLLVLTWWRDYKTLEPEEQRSVEPELLNMCICDLQQQIIFAMNANMRSKTKKRKELHRALWIAW